MIQFKQAKQLMDELKPAADAYYNRAESIMTDADYDQKKDRLVALYEKVLIPKKSYDLPLVKEIEEFLNQIGAPISTSEWNKATHKIPMTSLNKVNTEEEFIKWSQECHDDYYVIFDKMDGGSIDLRYEDSKLVQAITRGDGIEGEDVFKNVLKMQNVKATIPGFTGNLKGEVFMLRDDFDALNKISDREYKNPRNTATGLQKTLDGVNVNLLSIYFYDIEDDNEVFNTEEEKIKKIESYGIKTCFWKKVTLKEAIEVFNDYEANIRTSLQYDIDGLVIRCNSIAVQEKHGMLNSNPKAKIAWKFKPMQKETILRDIEWHLGNSRRITPIALLEPCAMGGVTVKRSTLHNIDIFKDMAFTRNCKVLLIRANDVIPQILENRSKNSTDFLQAAFKIPDICPECGEKAEIKGAYLMCTNDFCSGLGTGNLERWVKTLGIDDFGPKLIQVLYEKKMANEPADLYNLTVDQISNLDRMGERSATKILGNLRAKMQITLPELIAGLNIPNFGSSRTELLMAAGYDDVIKIFNATESDLVQVKGIETTTARQIIKGIQAKANIIKKLFEVGITIKKPEAVKIDSNKLVGKSFCFTGAISKIKPDGKRFTREDMQGLVKANGGKAEDSVRKGLTFLVMADPSSTSSKTQKAKDLGVNLLSEEDFFKMVQ